MDFFVLVWRRHGQATLRVDYPYAFVAIPFAKEWDRIYDRLTRPAGADAGWQVARAKEQPSSGGLMDNVANEILKAGLVIAEITAENRNVYYELGFAHALGKEAMLLIQKGNKMPSDLKGELHFEYDQDKLETERHRLVKELQDWDKKHSVTQTRNFYQS
jgi:nucleoside 2-deoxyribosyltransferase